MPFPLSVYACVLEHTVAIVTLSLSKAKSSWVDMGHTLNVYYLKSSHCAFQSNFVCY